MSTSSQTGFSITAAKFDTTGIENPFYESSSKGDSLIEQMKNNLMIVEEIDIVEYVDGDVEVVEDEENIDSEL